jgi:rod shape-determining protein MreC
MARRSDRAQAARAGAGLSQITAVARAVAQRYALTSLMLLSILLLVVGKADLRIVAMLREGAADGARLVLSPLRAPLGSVRDTADELGHLLAVKAENARLRQENDRLRRWQTEAIRLTVQNEALRALLNMPKSELAPVRTAARVVADSGSPFVRTRLIDAGADRGVRAGMAVVDEHGMIGRVVEVGQRSARVLLLTDFNSKIPVFVGRKLEPAILEGTNGRHPVLRFLPLDPGFELGDRVVTSGQGGVLPPGLAIGQIAGMVEGAVAVAPFVDWERLDQVAVLDFRPITLDGAGSGEERPAPKYTPPAIPLAQAAP